MQVIQVLPYFSKSIAQHMVIELYSPVVKTENSMAVLISFAVAALYHRPTSSKKVAAGFTISDSELLFNKIISMSLISGQAYTGAVRLPGAFDLGAGRL
jgi:hypothetical protein